MRASPPEPAAGLRQLLDAALAAVDAGSAVRRHLEVRDGRLSIAGAVVPRGESLHILAIGKAADRMLEAAIDVAGSLVSSALIVTKSGAPDGSTGARIGQLASVERQLGSHPLPDPRSEAAGRRVLAWVSALPHDDTLLVLLSGGASSLTACPASQLRTSDLRSTNAALMDAGADIESLNVVRKHVSAIAGGRLAESTFCGRIEVLCVSDVPGDRLDVIGSGPFAADPSTFADALGVVDRHGVRSALPASVVAHLEAGRSGLRKETPKPGDPVMSRVRSCIVACNRDAREAAARAARELGVRPVILGEVLCGEARRVGMRFAALARSLADRPTTVLIAGGETVVRVEGAGRGGRSQELALAGALELARPYGTAPSETALLASGSDGQDGPTDLSGAIVDGNTVARGRLRGLDAQALLEANDTYTFFRGEGDGLRTAVGLTNVMDLAMLWVPGHGDN